MTILVFVFIVSFLVLLWASKLLPKSISGIARILRLSEFITAFFLVAFATSVPELFVGISSALDGIPGISLGNIVGANFLNITFVIGLSVILGGAVKGDGEISSHNFWLIFLMALLPILLAADNVISRGDGVILLAAFGLYIIKIFHDERYFSKEVGQKKESERGLQSIPQLFHYIGIFTLGTALLLGSSFALMWSAKTIVGEYFLGNFVLFGVLFIALGTTLPELAFGIRSSMKGQGHLMLGNSIGSIAFNATAIVGLVALIRPITLDFNTNLLTASLFLFLGFALFHLFVYTYNKLSRREGFILLLLYIAFLAVEFYKCAECGIGPF